MRTVRHPSASALAIVLGLAMLTPLPAYGQTNNQGRLIVGVDNVHIVPATAVQQLRVTVANPASAEPTGTSDDAIFIVTASGAFGHVKQALDPGASYTFTVDPSTDGRLVDPRWGLYHVPVRFRIEAESVDGRTPPKPAVTIEVVNATSGELASFYAFQGFTGGVTVAAADVN